jgi:N-hydroxyarylamine O-acetyltransferase
MTLSDHDLDRYFRRIGYSGSAAATLDTLARLQALHTTVVPFENLDPLMRRPVPLDLPALARKFIDDERGGYCFEHNTFFQGVLRTLGFPVSGLAAMPLWNKPPSVTTPRTHMVLRVDLPEGPFIVDVGFGGLTLTSPVKLVSDVAQETTLELFRLVPDGLQFQTQVQLGGHWAPLYLLSLQDVMPEDYEVLNWFTSTHPNAIFTNHLMAARPAADRRYGLFNNAFSIHHCNGPTEKRTIEDPDELASVLREHFHVRLPEGCDAVLEKVTRHDR